MLPVHGDHFFDVERRRFNLAHQLLQHTQDGMLFERIKFILFRKMFPCPGQYASAATICRSWYRFCNGTFCVLGFRFANV